MIGRLLLAPQRREEFPTLGVLRIFRTFPKTGRRTIAVQSVAAMRGESLHKISELMGNSPEVCRRHYAALLP